MLRARCRHPKTVARQPRPHLPLRVCTSRSAAAHPSAPHAWLPTGITVSVRPSKTVSSLRRSYATESPEGQPPPRLSDDDEDIDPFNFAQQSPDVDELYEDAQEQDDEYRQEIGFYYPPLLLWDEDRAMDWTTVLRGRADMRFIAGIEDPLDVWGRPGLEHPELESERLLDRNPVTQPLVPRRRRPYWRKQLKKRGRFLLFWHLADNWKKFPLEPAFPEEIWEYDMDINEHIYHAPFNVYRVHHDLQTFQGNIPTRLDLLDRNGLVEKARRFYMPFDDGGLSPHLIPPKPSKDEEAGKGYKGVPFLKAEDVPLSAFAPNAKNLWTNIREQFNDAIFKRDWRPPASMAWDPLLNYAIPFWKEPRLRWPKGPYKKWKWRQHPADEQASRSLFYGSALLNPFDRAMAGSDRMDLPGYSRLDDLEKMMYGHRREMRKENSAAMRYQRSILHDEIERKAAELWARGTLAGNRAPPVHWDRRPKAKPRRWRRWMWMFLILFVLYALWMSGNANERYIAEQNWYQHPIVHDRARFHGFRVREMKVNGNGFWHALADQLYGTPEVWNWVRAGYFASWGVTTWTDLAKAPIGDVNDGTTLLDFYETSSLADVNWVKMWVRNLPGDFDEDYKNMEWTGRPGQTMSYFDMSPDYIHMRRDLMENRNLVPSVHIPEIWDAEEQADRGEPSAPSFNVFSDEMKYAMSLRGRHHPMDHIDMFYVASVMGIRINLLSTAYTIPHSKAWIHIDPAYGAVPKYEVNMLMHYVNGEIIGFDSLVPYDKREWIGLAMDPEKMARRRLKEARPGVMAVTHADNFFEFAKNKLNAIAMEEAVITNALSNV